MSRKKDNSTLVSKLALRQQALACCEDRVPVLETHGGFGRLYERLYDRNLGVVIEKDARKAEHLAGQRPFWRVYQGDAVRALAGGLAADVPFGLIDVDPYGSPFPVLEAIFEHPRRLQDRVELVVNDGLRQKVKLGGAWSVEALRPAVRRHGNNVYPIYAEVALETLEEIVAAAGYQVCAWTSRYTGHNNDMTHYWARLSRLSRAVSP